MKYFTTCFFSCWIIFFTMSCTKNIQINRETISSLKTRKEVKAYLGAPSFKVNGVDSLKWMYTRKENKFVNITFNKKDSVISSSCNPEAFKFKKSNRKGNEVLIVLGSLVVVSFIGLLISIP